MIGRLAIACGHSSDAGEAQASRGTSFAISSAPMPNRKRTLITSIALIAAVFLAYCSVRHFDFVY
jgi:uncharacterized membrane protein YvbJ